MSGLRDEEGDRKNPELSTDFHVGRARSGDRGGFAQLYERVAPSLDAWARIRVSGSLREYVEPGDVVQEVWWRAMDAFDRYDSDRSGFRPWIFRIATNVLLEWNRKRRRRMRIEPSALEERARALPPLLARQATSVGHGLTRRESVGKLVAIVKAMSAEDRAVFVQCGLEGKTAADASLVVGASEAAVKKRWLRLREKLSSHPVWRELEPSEE